MNHGLPAVTGKLILQPFQYQTSVCFALHIDEVDQDDSRDIPKPDLDSSFIRLAAVTLASLVLLPV